MNNIYGQPIFVGDIDELIKELSTDNKFPKIVEFTIPQIEENKELQNIVDLLCEQQYILYSLRGDGIRHISVSEHLQVSGSMLDPQQLEFDFSSGNENL